MSAYPQEINHRSIDHFAGDRRSVNSDRAVASVAPICYRGDLTEFLGHELTADWDAMETSQRLASLQKKNDQNQSMYNMRPCENRTKLMNRASIDTVGNISIVEEFTRLRDGDVGTQLPFRFIGMEDAANPPMLGKDIIFMRCMSPEMSRFDARQYPYSCLDQGTPCSLHTGLWSPKKLKCQQLRVDKLWKNRSTVHDDNKLITRSSQSISLTSTIGHHHQPLVIRLKSQETESLIIQDEALEENIIEEDLRDQFVTQIYTYLSLGYPAIGCKYDEELSTVSKVPLEELRKDDRRKNGKGYVEAPQKGGCEEPRIQTQQTGRWHALRIYIRVWQLQQLGIDVC